MKWYRDKGFLSYCALVSVMALGMAAIAYISISGPIITVTCIGDCWGK